MNNGVYLTLLDLARFDLMKRANTWQRLKKQKVHPVVVQESITFRKSLTPWLKFQIETKILGWDDQAFFVKLRFLRNPKGTPTPDEINLLAGGWSAPVPQLPDWVVQWNKSAALPKGKEPAPSDWTK